MKKITLLLFIASVTLSCSVNKYTDTNLSFSDGVSFKMKYINHYKFSELGENPNYQYIAGKGARILQARFTLKNNTAENKELNLNEFFLLDSKNHKYEPTALLQIGKFGYKNQQFDVKLKANSERTFIMNFKPAIDKDEKITAVVINGKEYKLTPSS